MEERPDALLKSALEKIVYFEARAEQLTNDLDASRAEAQRGRLELAAAAQREIDLRKQIAGLEVRETRAHLEREELGRMNEALRSERAALIGKLLEASRIHDADRPVADDDAGFDLASFISELRSEVLAGRTAGGTSRGDAGGSAAHSASGRDGAGFAASNASRGDAAGFAAHSASGRDGAGSAAHGASGRDPAGSAAHSASGRDADSTTGGVAAPGSRHGSEQLAFATVAPRPSRSLVAQHAERLSAEGRLEVSARQQRELCAEGEPFAGKSEETLFGFSVRELSAPDAPSRQRAAERLKALGHPAAAPALATALNLESEPRVQAALLGAFATFARTEGIPIVTPLLGSPVPDVRIAALKALITLDASQAGPHLAAATKDPDRAVRRRASLLALGLSGEAALALGEQAIRDEDSEVRALAALVLGASGGERSRQLVQGALRDREPKVRQAAAHALSRILGQDVSAVVSMDDAQRRREVRRLAALPSHPVTREWVPAGSPAAHSAHAQSSAQLSAAQPATAQSSPRPSVGQSSAALFSAAQLAAAQSAAAQSSPRPSPPRQVSEELCAALVLEVRSAIRGRSLANLSQATSREALAVEEALGLLAARGQVVRRGAKFFAA